MMKVLVFLAFLGLAAAGHPSHELDNIPPMPILLKERVTEAEVQQAKADAGEYFDMVMANLRDLMGAAGFHTIKMPNASYSFEREIIGIIWRGEANLYDGELRGLHTLHRTGAADITISPIGDIFITADVGVNKASLNYMMHVSFMDLGPTCDVTGTLSTVRIQMQLRISSADSTVHLTKFDIKNTGTLSLEISGLGAILDFLAELIVGFLGNLVKGIVVALLEGPIRDLVNDLIGSILFPPSAVEVFSRAQRAIIQSPYDYI